MTKTKLGIILGLIALMADTGHKLVNGDPVDWAVVIGAVTAASAALSAHNASTAVNPPAVVTQPVAK